MYVERTNYNKVITIKLVFPVNCNAKCSFCYCKDKNYNDISFNKKEFLSNFINTLDYLLSQINGKQEVSLDITGGEPTLDKTLFIQVMNRLREYHIQEKVCRVTLTSNGTNIVELAPYMSGVIDYVNISVHDFRPSIRGNIFDNKIFVDMDYAKIVSTLAEYKIKTSCACVVSQRCNDDWLDDFIAFCKNIGFIALRIRCNVFWSDQDEFDQWIYDIISSQKFQVINHEKTSDSHWCRLRRSDGFRIFMLHGVLDTSILTKGIEYVIAQNGHGYCDFYMKTPIENYQYEIGKIYDYKNEVTHDAIQSDL